MGEVAINLELDTGRLEVHGGGSTHLEASEPNGLVVIIIMDNNNHKSFSFCTPLVSLVVMIAVGIVVYY